MKSLFTPALAVTGLMVVLAGQASGQGSPSTAPRNAREAVSSHRPGEGDVNVQVSRVYTFVDKTGFGHQHAVEAKLKSGNLSLGAQRSAGEVEFDMRSFDADTLAARRYIGLSGATDASTRAKVNENMKGRDVLDVARFPTATFKVDSAVANGKTAADGLPVFELEGTFTLHGVSRPLKVAAVVEQARGWLHLRGKFDIQQSHYGITPYSTALGAVGVADALVIHGDIWVAPTSAIVMSSIPERR